MKKLLGALLFLGLLGGLGFYVLKNYFPNFIPPNKDVKQFLPTNSETFVSPIKVPDGNKLDVFTDLKGGLPRVLTFDENGVLFASLTSAGKIVALPDTDNNLVSEVAIDVITSLNKPHGIVFNGGYLYVAETDKVSRYRYNSETFTVGTKEVLFSLPGGGRHYTRTIKIHDNKLYTSVGSSCDVCIEKNPYRASILVSDLDGSNLKVYASGLRNTVFFDFDQAGRMVGFDMGRDNLGDSLPPDEFNVIEEGKNYGWPYCYGDRVKDMKFNDDPNFICDQTEPSAFDLPAHSAPLGIAFKTNGDILVALHGSWNSSTPVGYKIISLNSFAGGITSSSDFVDGFIKQTDVLGRPVDLVYDKNDNLFISDDKTGLIYVLSKE